MKKRSNKNLLRIGIIVGRISSIPIPLLIYPVIKSGDSVIAVVLIMLFCYWWFFRSLNEQKDYESEDHVSYFKRDRETNLYFSNKDDNDH